MKWYSTLTAGGYSTCMFCGNKVANWHSGKEDVLCFCDCEGASEVVKSGSFENARIVDLPARDFSKLIKPAKVTPEPKAAPAKKSDGGDLPW
jgi:hypothetical protein